MHVDTRTCTDMHATRTTSQNNFFQSCCLFFSLSVCAAGTPKYWARSSVAKPLDLPEVQLLFASFPTHQHLRSSSYLYSTSHYLMCIRSLSEWQWHIHGRGDLCVCGVVGVGRSGRVGWELRRRGAVGRVNDRTMRTRLCQISIPLSVHLCAWSVCAGRTRSYFRRQYSRFVLTSASAHAHAQHTHTGDERRSVCLEK